MWKVCVGNLLLIDAICIQQSEGGGSLCPPQEIDVKTFWIPHPLISRLDSSSYSVLRYNYKQFLNRNCIVCLTTVSVYHLLNLLIVSNFLAILIESGLPKEKREMKKIIFEQLKDCRSKWGCIKLLKKVISVVHTWTSLLINDHLCIVFVFQIANRQRSHSYFIIFGSMHHSSSRRLPLVGTLRRGCNFTVPNWPFAAPYFWMWSADFKKIWNCFKEKLSSISPIFEMQKLPQTASLLQIFLHCRCCITRNSLLVDDWSVVRPKLQHKAPKAHYSLFFKRCNHTVIYIGTYAPL